MNKKILIGVGIFALVVFWGVVIKFVVVDLVPEITADKCDVAYLSDKYKKKLQKSPQKPEVEKYLKIARAKMNKLKVPPEEREDLLVMGMVYSQLTKENCEVPEEFGMKMVDQLIRPEKEGTKVCRDDAYLAEAQEAYLDMHKGMVLGNAFEMAAFHGMMNGIGIPEGKEFLKVKWKDEKFRKRMMISVLQTTEREEKGCINPYLPLKKSILEIIALYSREKKK